MAQFMSNFASTLEVNQLNFETAQDVSQSTNLELAVADSRI